MPNRAWQRIGISIQSALRSELIKQSHSRIASGPFAQMSYRCVPPYPPYLLGTYEKHLWPTIAKLKNKSFATFVNLGAGHGYYACGLALLMENVRVIAFELTSERRQDTRALVEQNGLSRRVEIRGECTLDQLKLTMRETPPPHFVFVDVEGAERDLLVPDEVPDLRKATILVEIHDFVDRNIGHLIRSRFEGTHAIEEIWDRERVFPDFPFTAGLFRLFKRDAVRLMDETRPERMRWFFMEPGTV